MGYRGQRKSSYGSQHISGRTVAGIQNNRSLNAKLVDASLKAPIAKTEEQWMNAPNRYDLPDIDTPKVKTQAEARMELPKIETKVRPLGNEWEIKGQVHVAHPEGIKWYVQHWKEKGYLVAIRKNEAISAYQIFVKPIPKKKEPWEMSYREFFDYNNGMSEYSSGDKYGIPTHNRVPLEQGSLPEERIRKAVLRKAIEDGKNVPNEILEEYPELKLVAERYARAKTEGTESITWRNKYKPWNEITIERTPEGKYTKTIINFGKIESKTELTPEEGSHQAQLMASMGKSEHGPVTRIGHIPLKGVIQGSSATYNKATGWVSITFDSIPTEVTRNELKRNGFRYEPYSKRWRASYTTDREDLLKHYAGTIQEIDIKPNWAAKAEHAADMAAKHASISNELLDKRHNLLQVVQDEPIHVGHHSEKHHRADLAKMERWTEKAVEEHNLSKELTRKAERYGKLATGESSVTIYNRIKKLEADKRSMGRQLLGDIIELNGKFYRRKGSEPSQERKEEIKKWIAHYDSRLTVEREKYKASGGLPTDTMSLKAGDTVNTRFGTFTISKVNDKTVLGRFVGSDEHLNFGISHRKMDKTDITEKIS